MNKYLGKHVFSKDKQPEELPQDQMDYFLQLLLCVAGHPQFARIGSRKMKQRLHLPFVSRIKAFVFNKNSNKKAKPVPVMHPKGIA